MLGSFIGLLAMLVIMPVVAQQQAPTCDQLRQMLKQGHTIQDLEKMARQRGIPEKVIQDYKVRCHLS